MRRLDETPRFRLRGSGAAAGAIWLCAASLTLVVACGGSSDDGASSDGTPTDGSGADVVDDGLPAGDGSPTDGATGLDDAGPPGEPSCPGPFTWLDFTVVSATRDGRPSQFSEFDTRAGSMDVHLNGGHGFGTGESDPAFAAAFLTLRNGAGDILEELQVNRRYQPVRLDSDGCALESAFPQCWIPAPDEPTGTARDAALPRRARDSNEGFDDSGERVAVSGGVRIDLGDEPPVDNRHETVRVTWDAPEGIDGARLLLRASYRAAPGPDGVEPPAFAVPLLSSGWSEHGDGLEVRVPIVGEVERTATRRVVELDVERALRYVCGFTRGCTVHGEPHLALVGPLATWTLRNDGDEPVTFDALLVTWPAENGALVEVTLGEQILLDTPHAPSSLRLDAADMREPATIAAGATALLSFRFAAPVSRISDAYHARLDSAEGCMVELARRSCSVPRSECPGGGLPLALTLAYVGTDCGASSFAQDPAGVACSGDPKFATPVHVVATDGTVPAAEADVLFDGTLARAERFAVDPSAFGATALPAVTRVQVFTPEDDLLQEVTFSTACGVSLIEGDLFGAIRLAGCGSPAGD